MDRTGARAASDQSRALVHRGQQIGAATRRSQAPKCEREAVIGEPETRHTCHSRHSRSGPILSHEQAAPCRKVKQHNF
jgi:hypothetical protein